MKREPVAGGYNWATLSLGDINTETWSPRLGLDPRLTNFLCKKNIIAKSKKVKTGCSVTEFSKEGYGSERVVCR
jgi:hypothetical protein